jgi:uncharacterized protein (TIGR02145 family)
LKAPKNKVQKEKTYKMKKIFTITITALSLNAFAQIPGGGVTDIQGNSYPTVWIGGIEWMAENLKTALYNDGTAIPTLSTNWGFNWSGLQCVYDNNNANLEKYGRLYNHFVVDKVCPSGWHVPTMNEIGILKSHLGWSPNNGSQPYGGSLKSTGTLESGDGLWYTPNQGATNLTNFSANPSGYRSYESPTYQKKGYAAVFWAQDIIEYNCDYGGNNVALHDCGGTWSVSYNHDYLLTGRSAESTGLSIRCANNINQLGIIEINNSNLKKELVMIVDLMGRETSESTNTVLIYIYSDGSHERIFKLQE